MLGTKSKAKGQKELPQEIDIKGSQMVFKCIRSEQQTKESVDLLLNGEGELTKDIKKDEVLNSYFDSIFTKKVKDNLLLNYY